LEENAKSRDRRASSREYWGGDNMLRSALPAILAAAAIAAPGSASAADVMSEWNSQLLSAIAASNTAPPRASRMMAMMNVAAYEAVNSVSRRFTPYHQYVNAPAGASREAAAAVASHHVLSQLFPSRQAILDAQLNTHLGLIADGPSKTHGVMLGTSCGQDIIASRSNDNSDMNTTYTGGNAIGQWRPTGPGFQPAAVPHWRYVTPWSVNSATQFRPGPPPDVNSTEYAAAYEEVKELGAANSATRTQHQTDTAFLWRAGGNTVTPPGQWMQVTQQMVAERELEIDESARAFALVGIAVADAGITSWETKNLYDYWRPETGIQLGDADGNAATAGDASWTPLLTTPNHQSYTSGHSTFSAAAAAVLTGLFGTQNISFTVSGDNITRGYSSFADAAADAGMSRIFGGIHWQFDNQAGLASGAAVGQWVLANSLVVPTPGAIGVLGVGVLALARRRR
jgi:hypothetical protein